MLKTINGGKEPTKGSKYSACIDLYAREDVVIGAGETKMIPLGVCIDYIKLFNNVKKDLGYDYYHKKKDGGFFEHTAKEIVQDVNEFLSTHCIKLFPRSSFRAKGLISHTGIIDFDFKDEWQIIVHNPMKKSWVEKLLSYTLLKHFDISVKNKFVYDFDFIIKKGDKVAQAMIVEHKTSLFGIETEEERNGGFGSTGR